jgi:putative spermidine/putrescine transport system substrate-binding protein
MKLKLSRVAVVGVAAVVVLAGCSAPETPSEPSGGSGAAPVAGVAEPGSFQGQAFSMAANGGTTQDAQNAIFQEFADIVGAQFAPDGPPTTAAVQAQVDANNVIWDIVDAPEVDLALGCGTVYQELDYSKIDTSQLSEHVPQNPCGVAINASPWTFAYNKDAWDKAPTSWADFFDQEKFPGTRAIYAGFPMQQIEAALLGAGVAPEDLENPDVDLGYEMLDKIKGDLIFYAAGSEAQQMMATNQVAACICWSGRVYTEIENGSNWGLVETAPPILRMDYWSIPIGSKNTDLAHAAINYYIGPDQQSFWQEATAYPSMNVNSKPNLSDAAKQVDVFREPFEPVTIDVEFWAKDLSNQLDRWTTWTSK